MNMYTTLCLSIFLLLNIHVWVVSSFWPQWLMLPFLYKAWTHDLLFLGQEPRRAIVGS